MRTVDHLEVSYAQFPRPEKKIRQGLFSQLERHQVMVIFLTVMLAFGVRVYQLDAAGLSEDETNKVFALRAYEQGDFTANTEHPMVMKLLCFVSLRSAKGWNQTLGDNLQLGISEETALRLPNVIFGALTVIPLLLLTTAFLGFEAGVITALLWAFGLNAVWFNRIGKEDTLLLFFMLLGFYFYHRAKEQLAINLEGQEKFYALAGAAFGLMVGAKYFPHYIGLNALFYTIIGYHQRTNRPLTGRMWAKYFGGMVLALALFNPAVFAPQTWRYVYAYVNEDLLTHHGYVMMGKLFNNDAMDTPAGNPWYFYLLYLAVKVPLPMLLAFAVGVVEIFRRRGEARVARGYLFLRLMLIFWLLPMSVIGSKFLRYTLTLMPWVYMTAAVGILVCWRGLAKLFRSPVLAAPQGERLAAVVVALVFVIAPAFITLRWGLPYPGLYTNSFGKGRVGYFFPHDEFYDVGARESVKYLAETAPPNATIASEIPGVVEYYLERYHRLDIRSLILSQPDFNFHSDNVDYVLLQKGRVYFENAKNFYYIENHYPEVQASFYQGVASTQVHQLDKPTVKNIGVASK
ncbi:MAG: glycosyltransferase family 39 protein [Acidobacteria bacterium]|nr:glycosyltransferase family 39 protein [Acidobacteriota bacterium]